MASRKSLRDLTRALNRSWLARQCGYEPTRFWQFLSGARRMPDDAVPKFAVLTSCTRTEVRDAIAETLRRYEKTREPA